MQLGSVMSGGHFRLLLKKSVPVIDSGAKSRKT